MHQVPPMSGGVTIYLLTAVIDNADLNYSLQITSDLQEFIEEQQVAAPFIIEYGSDFYVTVEKELYEVDSFVESLCILFAIYYVFDIAYTKGCANTLLVLEKNSTQDKFGPKTSEVCSWNSVRHIEVTVTFSDGHAYNNYRVYNIIGTCPVCGVPYCEDVILTPVKATL